MRPTRVTDRAEQSSKLEAHALETADDLADDSELPATQTQTADTQDVANDVAEPRSGEKEGVCDVVNAEFALSCDFCSVSLAPLSSTSEEKIIGIPVCVTCAMCSNSQHRYTHISVYPSQGHANVEETGGRNGAIDSTTGRTASYEIPPGVTSSNIDSLMLAATDENEVRELERCQRLLRNKQAA